MRAKIIKPERRYKTEEIYKMKRFFAAIAAALTLFAAGGAEAAALRVGTDADFQPYEYYREGDGAFTGFDIELMEELAKLMGYDGVEFVEVSFHDLLGGLNEDKYDAAIAALIVTAERRHEADFSVPYAEDRTVTVTVTGRAAPVGKNMKTVTEKGTTHMVFAQQNYAQQGEIIVADNIKQAVDLLFAGKAGRAVTSKLSARYLIENVYDGRLVITSEDGVAQPLAIAVRKGNAELLDKINDALARCKESGAYDKLYAKYFGADK